MDTLTLKVPEETSRWLARSARRSCRPKSAIVREALELYRARENAGSALELAGDLVGKVQSGQRDLGSNKKHLRGFGR